MLLVFVNKKRLTFDPPWEIYVGANFFRIGKPHEKHHWILRSGLVAAALWATTVSQEGVNSIGQNGTAGERCRDSRINKLSRAKAQRVHTRCRAHKV